MSNKTSALLTLKESTTFRCNSCKQNLELPVERVEDLPAEELHPFEYFAHCPTCRSEIKEAPFLKNLYRAWSNITGTKSPEKSAANLPSPNDPRRKFNALKSGIYAKAAKYFPAKVGRYPECGGCEHSHECEAIGICLEVSKLKMMVMHAFDSKDPAALQPLFEEIQGDLFVLIKRLIFRALKDGVILEAPVFGNSQFGPILLKDDQGNQVIEFTAHPALKLLTDLIQKNGLSLADLQMTPKTQADHAAQMGNLKGQADDRMSAKEFEQKKLEQTQKFFDALTTATARRERDPVFQAHQEEAGAILVDHKETEE